MAELFVVETRERRRGKTHEWVPDPTAYSVPHDALRAMQDKGIKNKRVVVYRRAGLVNAIRCEDCDLLVHGDELPEGWSQFGKSRFVDAPSGLAAHCPEHS